jgi:formamidopyrimidine-DNA glycosylase
MQALAERLDATLGGRRLDGFEPIGFAGLKTVVPAPDVLLGTTLHGVSRRGKYLVFDFGDARVLLHLSQAGRVDVETPPKHTRGRGGVVRLLFGADGADGGEIGVLVREFGKERKAAWWVLGAGDDGPLTGLGPEPDSTEFEELIRAGDDKRRVHTILRDQHTIAGIGRGYSDDVLWRAQLSPYSSLASLDADQRTRLVEAVRSALADGLTKERAREGGLSAPKLGTNFEIHGHAGTPCPRCGEGLRRVSYESYEVVYCPLCQTGGKVLADRRMSRLVK